MQLGLSDEDVVLVPHDSAWEEEFNKEKVHLEKFIRDALDVQHCGSTSIPNIPSKPIMNICISVPSLNNLEALTEEMLKAGYIYKPSDFGEHELFIKKDGELSTHHAHVMAEDSLNWKKAIMFRDHLRANPDIAEVYADLKTLLAQQFPHDRKMYGEGKNPFFDKVLKDLL